VVTFSFGIANFFGSPILGALSDSFGRRPVLLIGFCGFALNFFLTALATSLLMLVAVRLVGGAMQANLSVANATSPTSRCRRAARNASALWGRCSASASSLGR
jgi:DHA1 family tetracycline resistance protein-like MFS transporter